MGETARRSNTAMLAAVFNPAVPRRLYCFVDSLSGGTAVEVVWGYDDLCASIECPYHDDCAAGRYRKVQNAMMAKLPPETPGDVLRALRESDPAIEDGKACDALAIRIGEIHQLGQLLGIGRDSPSDGRRRNGDS
jgi:hypothetical protein